MRRKSAKTMIDVTEDVSVVHFNVGAGYVTYLQRDGKAGAPKLKSIVLIEGGEA